MADMYGAVRSNWFKVKDIEAFKTWFKSSVRFGDDIEVWTEQQREGADVVVGFGGVEQYPNAYPMTIPRCNLPLDHPDYDADDCDSYEWDLEAFAAEVREHLQDGEEFRVLAAGNEKLRYVQATHLVITHDSAKFDVLYEGN
jgi:hypothetical protein